MSRPPMLREHKLNSRLVILIDDEMNALIEELKRAPYLFNVPECIRQILKVELPKLKDAPTD